MHFYRLKQDYLKFEGNERLDLINRLSTNQVTPLDKNKGVKTILTSDKGRFVDLLTIYNFGDFVFAACSFSNAKAVLEHLDRYTIMDDFRPTDMAGSHETILCYGKGADELANKLGVDLSTLADNDFVFNNVEGKDSIIVNNDDAFGGFHFIFSAADKDFWYERILKGSGASEVSDDEYEVKRIELGVPKHGAEMSVLTNPLECGMNQYVSFTKGCYIGQEVIARLDAYDKISKHMVGLKLSEPVEGDAKITIDGKECGFLTSTAYSNEFGNIGLGFVKTIFLDYDKAYKLKQGEKLIDCSIVKLPFTNN